MSVERVRSLLGLEGVGIAVTRHRRQQITPDINFTCDGMITKWIVGGHWSNGGYLYPELQMWRNIGNDAYEDVGWVVQLVHAARGCGELLPHYADTLLAAVLSSARDPHPLVRASALSSLAEICRLLGHSFGKIHHEVTDM